MSYILEALRKAEQQRRLGDVPGLDDAQVIPTPERKQWKWGWVLLGVMNIALLALLLWPESKESEDVPLMSKQDGETFIQSEISQTVTRPASRRPSEKPVQKQTPDDITHSQVNAPPLRPIPPPAATPPQNIKPGRVIQADTVIQPEVEIADTEVESSDLPAWPQLSAGLLSQIGDSLRLDVHVYADRPEERFVLINLKKYREGEQLREGPTLEEVTSDGAVMSFQGERFRIDAK